jgi:hypothetical protein
MDDMKVPVHETLVEISPTNEQDNSWTIRLVWGIWGYRQGEPSKDDLICDIDNS